MGTHTPGPWHTTPNPSISIIGVFDESGYRLAAVEKFKTNGKALECQANARLIAAAPELLEAIKIALGEIDYTSRYKHGEDLIQHIIMRENIQELLETAINKAEGKV